MIPKSMLQPALEGNTDAQAMLADYLKEHSTPDHTADEAYFGAIHIRCGHRCIAPNTGYRVELLGRGDGYGVGSGFGTRQGRGGGYGSGLGVGGGYGSWQGRG